MKTLRMLATLLVLVVASLSANASSAVQSYAHPTMFGSNVYDSANGKYEFVVGENLQKAVESLTVTEKKNVLIDSWATDVLALLKANSAGVFNPKMPILRSEMAVVLAEGLNIEKSAPRYRYTDIANDYWAKSWIDKALTEGVMIGYPDKKFRPDQPITKAEVFATIAQLINVPTDKSLIVPDFKGHKMQNIPAWATAPTKEVLASKLLEEIPNPEKAAASKYLSKEQVAYLVAALRQSMAYRCKFSSGKYTPTYVKVEMTERVDARHANIGDTFYARLTEDTTVLGTKFPAKSLVKGEVVEVSRPGLNNPGYLKIKFLSVKNGDTVVEIPNTITDVTAKDAKTTNVVARVLGAPFSMAGRVLGVAGRGVSAIGNSASNNTERLGDNLSNTLVNTASLEPMAGARSLGQGFVTVGRFVVDSAKVVASGTFGVVYEFGDELRYLILPSSVNDSALNAGDELVIIY